MTKQDIQTLGDAYYDSFEITLSNGGVEPKIYSAIGKINNNGRLIVDSYTVYVENEGTGTEDAYYTSSNNRAIPTPPAAPVETFHDRLEAYKAANAANLKHVRYLSQTSNSVIAEVLWSDNSIKHFFIKDDVNGISADDVVTITAAEVAKMKF